MANTSSAKKAARQTIRRTEVNKARHSALKTGVRKVEEAISAGDKAAAEAALKLADYRKMAPGPVEEFLFYDHPSGRTRIRMAMTWKAENLSSSTP